MAHAMPGDDAVGAMRGDDLANDQMRVRSVVTELNSPMQAAFKIDRRFHDSAGSHEGRGQGVEASFCDFAD